MIRHMNSIGDNDITIILGDFNIDAYKENTNLKLLLEQYTMIVSDPTHLSGSLLDHIYVCMPFYVVHYHNNLMKAHHYHKSH